MSTYTSSLGKKERSEATQGVKNEASLTEATQLSSEVRPTLPWLCRVGSPERRSQRWPLRVGGSSSTAHSAHQAWRPFSCGYKPSKQQEGWAQPLTEQHCLLKGGILKKCWKYLCKHPFSLSLWSSVSAFPEGANGPTKVHTSPNIPWRLNFSLLPYLGTFKYPFQFLHESRSDPECRKTHLLSSDLIWEGPVRFSGDNCQILLPVSLLKWGLLSALLVWAGLIKFVREMLVKAMT